MNIRVANTQYVKTPSNKHERNRENRHEFSARRQAAVYTQVSRNKLVVSKIKQERETDECNERNGPEVLSLSGTHTQLASDYTPCTGAAGKYDVKGSKGKEMEISPWIECFLVFVFFIVHLPLAPP